jgi:hypothetical protein
MSRVNHFEIHAADPERASSFYRAVFGWTIQKWHGPADYWLITTGPDSEPGINGAIMRRNGEIDGAAVIAYVCTISVDSVDEAVEKIAVNGGDITVLPKMPVPGIGWSAYCKDTEGNIFGLMQADPSVTG